MWMKFCIIILFDIVLIEELDSFVDKSLILNKVVDIGFIKLVNWV